MIDDEDLYYGEAINIPMHAYKHGNYIISGCGVTANGSSNLTTTANDIDIASGSIYINGSVVSVSADNQSLDTEYGALGTGKARFLYIYADTGGLIQVLAGTIADDGSHRPPDFSSSVPDDAVLLARIELVEGTTTLTASAIKDIRIGFPIELYLTGLNIGNSTRVTSIKDEDDMNSDLATALVTQQSVKAYVDSFTVIQYPAAQIIGRDEDGVTLNPGTVISLATVMQSVEITTTIDHTEAFYPPLITLTIAKVRVFVQSKSAGSTGDLAYIIFRNDADTANEDVLQTTMSNISSSGEWREIAPSYFPKTFTGSETLVILLTRASTDDNILIHKIEVTYTP